MIQTVLVDARNFKEIAPQIRTEIAEASLIGLDCETHNENRHDGMARYCGKKKVHFDFRRIDMTGFSIHCENSPYAYYFNLGHADSQNRLEPSCALALLHCKAPTASWVCHNLPFELTVFKSCLDFDLGVNSICTMQLAVSTYGPDEYDVQTLRRSKLGAMYVKLREIEYEAETYEGGPMPARLQALCGKITAKESKATFSWNGFVKEIGWRYGLKGIVKQFFGVDMTTYQQVLGDKAHMGLLTGEEVAAYGADDAYWALRVLGYLWPRMAAQNDRLPVTFMRQENAMTRIYSQIALGGMKVDPLAISLARSRERAAFAQCLRDLKAALAPYGFPEQPDARLMKREGWYQKNWQKYRANLLKWLSLPDSPDDYTQVQQVRSAVGKAWLEQTGDNESLGPNMTYYMTLRLIMYDMLGAPLVVAKGKVQSNGNARGTILAKFNIRLEREQGEEPGDDEDEEEEGYLEDEGQMRDYARSIRGLELVARMAKIEQRMKLFITPYLNLLDPETHRVYPQVNSMLATRRMAAAHPNSTQVAKRGESSYIRSFYTGDNPEHLMVSVDWSAIELVLIGEASGDPSFAKAYAQTPHDDLHTGAAAGILEVTETEFKLLKSVGDWEAWKTLCAMGPGRDIKRISTDTKGTPLTPGEANKLWRTEIGKGSNFEYWYSGWLSNLADRMKWTFEETIASVEKYRLHFSVAEQWRLDLIERVKRDGYITLPDGHRRTRLEATDVFQRIMTAKMEEVSEDKGYRLACLRILKQIAKRACNQAVNAYIQGSCATLAKRSMVRIDTWIHEFDARLLGPVHDEILFSCHYRQVPDFIDRIMHSMLDHPEMFQRLKPDASPSVGWTYEPWDAVKAPFGQVEIYESPRLNCIPAGRHGKRMTREDLVAVCEGLHARELPSGQTERAR